MPQVINLPNFFKPIKSFTLKFNPNYQVVCGESRKWIINCAGEFKEKYLREDLSLVSVYILPRVDADRLRIFIDWNNLFFLIDDHLEQDDKKSAKIFEMVRGITMNVDYHVETKLGCATKERLKQTLSHEGYQNYCNLVMEYLSGVKIENSLKKSEEIPSYETYREKRVKTIGATLWLCLCLHLNEIKISQTKDFSIFDGILSEIIFITNDIFSFCKELKQSRNDTNTIRILMQSTNCSMQEAFDKSAEIYNEKITEYLSLKEQFLDKSNDDVELKRFFETYEDIILGNLLWSTTTTRYTQASEKFLFLAPLQTFQLADN